jgi:hypothetical protein
MPELGIRGTDFEATIAPDKSRRLKLYEGEVEYTDRHTGTKIVLLQVKACKPPATGALASRCSCLSLKRTCDTKEEMNHKSKNDSFGTYDSSFVMRNRATARCSLLIPRQELSRGVPPQDEMAAWRPEAVTATAYKPARIVYHLLSTKGPYTEDVLV